jgi:predicted transcriptional regulator
MQPPAHDVTDAELRVLEVLWEQGPATVRVIRDALYPNGGMSKSATVLKLLERLEGKGFVGRQRSETAQQFHVRVDRDTLIGGQLRRIAQRLGANSLTPLLVHLVQSGGLTDEERAHLRQLLDVHSASPGGAGAKHGKCSPEDSQ